MAFSIETCPLSCVRLFDLNSTLSYIYISCSSFHFPSTPLLIPLFVDFQNHFMSCALQLYFGFFLWVTLNVKVFFSFQIEYVLAIKQFGTTESIKKKNSGTSNLFQGQLLLALFCIPFSCFSVLYKICYKIFLFYMLPILKTALFFRTWIAFSTCFQNHHVKCIYFFCAPTFKYSEYH